MPSQYFSYGKMGPINIGLNEFVLPNVELESASEGEVQAETFLLRPLW